MTEKLDWREFLTGDLKPEDIKAFDEYFEQFTKPDGKCPGCKKEFAEGIIAMLGGGVDTVAVEWGMVNGEANCKGCGYPYRGLHRNVGPLESLGPWFLAYHPDTLNKNGAKK